MGRPVEPVAGSPGDISARLSLTLQYFGSSTITSLHAILDLPEAFTDHLGGSQALSHAVNIQPGSTFVVPFLLNVASDAAISGYPVQLRMLWNDTLTSGKTTALTANIPLNGRADLAVRASEAALSPGRISTINLLLANTGTGPAYQIRLSPSLTGGSVLGPVDTVDRIDAGSTATIPVQVFVPQSSAGVPVSLSLSLSFYDPYGNPRVSLESVGLFVPISATALSNLVVDISPRALLGGQLNDVTVSVTNQGQSAVSDVSIAFSTSSPSLTWLRPTLLQIPMVDAGKKVDVQGAVYVNAGAPDSTSHQLNLRYYDSNNNLNQETRSFGLLTEGIVQLVLQDASTIPQKPGAGQVFSISGTLTNIGTTTATGLRVVPLLPEGFAAFGSPSIFVGDVPVNTPTPFTISISVSGSVPPGSYEIPLNMSYRNNLRENLTATASVPVSVVALATSAAGGATSPTGGGEGAGLRLFQFVIPLVVGAAAGVAGFLFARRRYSRR